MIVSVAFREPYITHSKRQEDWIRKNHPDLNLLYFRDELPTATGIVTENIVGTFQKSLYGFKVHAIQQAIDAGARKVIWLDPSVLPTSSLKNLTEALDKRPMIVRTGDNPISKMCNKKAFDWFETDEYQTRNVMHVGGTIYGFNFNDPKAVRVFESWKTAEENGIFGTQDDFMAGHWADEACMALSMWEYGVEQYYPEKFTYINQKEMPV